MLTPHPEATLITELATAAARNDQARYSECQAFLEARGWRVVVERCQPPRPRREPPAETPPPIIGAMSPAEEAIHFRDRPRRQGPGVC